MVILLWAAVLLFLANLSRSVPAGGELDAALPKVFLWQAKDSGVNGTTGDYKSKGMGIWKRMFDHQLYVKELLKKCNQVTHQLVSKADKADTLLCSEVTHGNSVHKNRDMLNQFTTMAKKYVLAKPGRSAGLVIGSKKTRREFGVHVGMLAKRGLMVFGTEVINSDYHDFADGPIAAMFVPIPYAASIVPPESSSRVDDSAERRYMFAFIGTTNVSVWLNQRSRVVDALQQRTDSFVRIPEKRHRVKESEFDVYRNSKFCPAPGGDSRSSKRFYDGIVHGCIPVVCDKAFPLPFHSQTPILNVVQYIDCSTPKSISEALDGLARRQARIRRRVQAAMEDVRASYNYSSCQLMGHLLQEVKNRQSLPLLFSDFVSEV